MTIKKKKSLADRLGASRVEKLPAPPAKSPLGLLHLQHEIQTRLRSSGGRPSDPSWTVSRQVPFKPEVWADLQSEAERLGQSGPRVGPAQIAAILIEEGLEAESAISQRWNRLLDKSRKVVWLSQPHAAEAAGVTYRQFVEWVRTGKVESERSQTGRPLIGADSIVLARTVVRLRQLGIAVKVAFDALASVDLGRRFLVISTDEGDDRRLDVKALLSLSPEGSEAMVVIDQLPIRERLLRLVGEELDEGSGEGGEIPRAAVI